MTDMKNRYLIEQLLRPPVEWQPVLKLMRYQFNLLVLPRLLISPRRIPISDKKLYLGLEFEWNARY